MTTLEVDIWENQRLSVSDNVYSPENRVSGDRPPWSSKDGKHAQHRDAFLLPDLSWQWDGTWFVADINGNKVTDTNGGWLYAPSYLISTKRCSAEPNALSLVRRRRWMRKARKDPTLASMPHPVLVVHYGLSSAPEAVASCANSPMTNSVKGAAGGSGGFSAFAAMIKSPFQKLSNAFSSPVSPPPSNARNNGSATPAASSSSSSPVVQHLAPSSLPSSASPVSGGEVALLLKHQATFDVMQTFMAELLAAATNPSLDPTIPSNIQVILRESGVPQLLRAPLWLGFSGALMMKMKHPGRYRKLLEQSAPKFKDLSCSINLDVTRTYASHMYFAGGTGPGAQKLRNVLFAFQEQELQNLAEAKKCKRREAAEEARRKVEEAERKRKLAQDPTKATTDDVLDHLFAPSSSTTTTTTTTTTTAATATATDGGDGKKGKKTQEDKNHHEGGADKKQDGNNKNDSDDDDDGAEPPTVYHQPLSYIGSIFVLNCMDEEDAFWLLTVMAERCPLLAPTPEGGELMHDAVQKFVVDLQRKAPTAYIQSVLAQVDLSISAYGWFQALLCAHVSCPVASRLFDIFLVDVKNSMVFVDFAVALVLKCMTEDNALEQFAAGEAGRLDTVTVSKFVNEQLRKVSCDIRL